MAQTWIQAGYNASLVLRIVGVARSTYYYRQSHPEKPRPGGKGREPSEYTWTQDGRKVSNEQVKEWLMEAVEGEGVAYGYVKLTHWLRQEQHLVINKKKVYRLCKELDILRPQREIRHRPPRTLARNHEVTGPNQVWEADLKYGYIAGEDRFFYVLNVLDVYDRSLVGYHVGRKCEARQAVWALRQALLHRKPVQMRVLRTDNGPQFVSEVFDQACTELGVEHERIPSRTPNMNAHIEAYHRILEEECLSRHEFESFAEAYAAITKFVEFYNHRRLHSGLHYLPPSEFLRRHEDQGLAPVKAVRV